MKIATLAEPPPLIIEIPLIASPRGQSFLAFAQAEHAVSLDDGYAWLRCRRLLLDPFLEISQMLLTGGARQAEAVLAKIFPAQANCSIALLALEESRDWRALDERITPIFTAFLEHEAAAVEVLRMEAEALAEAHDALARAEATVKASLEADQTIADARRRVEALAARQAA